MLYYTLLNALIYFKYYSLLYYCSLKNVNTVRLFIECTSYSNKFIDPGYLRSSGGRGFFLFVEAGLIDVAHHFNLAGNALTDTLALDNAIAAGKREQ